MKALYIENTSETSVVKLKVFHILLST